MAKRQRDPRKEAFWRRVLARWQGSGQSGRDFCRAAGLSEPSFYAWRRELARRDAAARPKFLPVRVLGAKWGHPRLNFIQDVPYYVVGCPLLRRTVHQGRRRTGHREPHAG